VSGVEEGDRVFLNPPKDYKREQQEKEQQQWT
jgi:HlyD family secretion protein